LIDELLRLALFYDGNMLLSKDAETFEISSIPRFPPMIFFDCMGGCPL
jgi:hypothetical protein